MRGPNGVMVGAICGLALVACDSGTKTGKHSLLDAPLVEMTSGEVMGNPKHSIKLPKGTKGTKYNWEATGKGGGYDVTLTVIVARHSGLAELPDDAKRVREVGSGDFSGKMYSMRRSLVVVGSLGSTACEAEVEYDITASEPPPALYLGLLTGICGSISTDG
jgi:hypothetical protein